MSIDELLALAYETESMDETKKYTRKILEKNPNHPEALLLLSDTLDDDEERLTLLRRAYKIAKKDFEDESRGVEPDMVMTLETGMIFAGVLQRMVIPLADSGKEDEAFRLAENLMALDPENETKSRDLYYYMMLKEKDYRRVLEETMKDPVVCLAWAWSRFIAVFMLSGGAASAKNFWEAVGMNPDVPFYMFGKYEEPVMRGDDTDDEEEQEDFAFALLFLEHVSCLSEELLSYVMSMTHLFGLLSGRITDGDPDEFDSAMEVLRGTDLMETYLKLLDETDGTSPDDDDLIKIISEALSC